MKFSAAAQLLAIVSLTSASSHVTVLLAGPNGVANVDVPTNNRPLNVAQRVPGDVERATLTYAPSDLSQARCRAFLDKEGTQLIGGKIEKDKDTPLGGEIKSLRCHSTLVLDGSFEVRRWVGGKTDGHERSRPNPTPASKTVSPPAEGDAGKTVTINIGNQRAAGYKRIRLDNTPFVLPDNPPNFNPIDKAKMVDDAGVTGAQCQAYSDEAATVSVGNKVSSSSQQSYDSSQTVMSFRCNIKGGGTADPPSGPSTNTFPPAAAATFTTDPGKSASVRVGNSETGSVKTIRLDNEVFVLANNPPLVGDIEDVAMNSDGGAPRASCNTYSDTAGVVSLKKPISVGKDQKFAPPGETVVSLRCHILKTEDVPPIAGSPPSNSSPAAPTQGSDPPGTDPSKSIKLNIGNQQTASTKSISLDNQPFLLSQNPPSVGEVAFATMIDDAGVANARCQSYSDDAARISVGTPVTVRSSTMFNAKSGGEVVRSFRCNIGSVKTKRVANVSGLRFRA